ncbi:solute carrier family 25 member 48-like isoform X21 [Oncorhynchus keta]|uniref:solute carrier family 25 member 48-like isoform X18 n=1 Tax=Oncorhynchus keta TaxID=8018 RepID=UPI00227D21C5|nr:solute carrier family 25 member 48-like isoform X18 [Oncorhynchus keta]XP_052343466.1 solute carrier family 25 member 48-like isoform X19 [Oncorhynchus keta]XP_052343467.1 solute carrier family 25 member 48-like isoform X20 [Oncorhynchus keta]XP_052343468.1 solute carrier family 25 member 48-like isoform X21 [Oncorhynchus keta]
MNCFHLDDFLAGWIGGASSVIVGHPLDTVKTRLQAGKGYKNTLHCVLQIYRKETIAGFFKGLSFPLASITVYNSVVFGFFNNTQRVISKFRHGDERQSCGMLDMTLASMLTGLMSVGLGAPVDLVKIRLQMQTLPCLAENLDLAGTTGNVNSNIAVRSMTLQGQPTYRGPIHCISSILRTEGIRGLYRGAGAMVLRDVPGYTLYFIPYALFRRWLSPEGRSSPHPCTVWVSGGLAGSISWVTATPADVFYLVGHGYSSRRVLSRGSRLLQQTCSISWVTATPADVFYLVGHGYSSRRVLSRGSRLLQQTCSISWVTATPADVFLSTGSISWVTATPADVVKSRLQADALHARKYRGIVHCVVQSYKTEGIHVFFRGASVNAVRGFPMSATMFLGYELSLQFFRGL